MHTLLEDTIAAVATPVGKGGIGIVRLSGSQSLALARSILSDSADVAQDRVPFLARIVEPGTGHRIDQALVTCFRAPRSYTGEDVVEISCHGSPVVLNATLDLLVQAGARLATPGEFTLRAFLRGRMDLVQAEAVRDLIEAKTLFQAKVAHQQVAGSLSHKLKPLKDGLVRLISLLEAGIDFAEDDVPPLSSEEIRERLDFLVYGLDQLYASYRNGKIVGMGLSLAIVGRPNVGKSSLFNALLRQDRAIVTEIPGTTRDLIAESIEIRGIPFRFLDTAGIRKVSEPVEQIGIDKSLEALADADRVLLVLDGSEEFTEADRDLMGLLGNRRYTVVINKSDLPQKTGWERILAERGAFISVSAKTGAGVEFVKETLVEDVNRDGALEGEGSFVTNIRHAELLGKTVEALTRVRESRQSELPHEILLLDCYAGLKALNALTGETTLEDILDNIFSTFCIGK
jgi:tRNA modification GTPase